MKRISFFVSLLVASKFFALPQDLNVVRGKASLSLQSPEVMEIIAKDKSILQWSEFSVGDSERVTFIQENSASCVLNRVLGENPSHIFGRLDSNGKILLINPNGILFGSDAQIDLGSFIASTLDLSNSDFLDQKDWHFTGNSENEISNSGSVNTEGNLTFISKQVDNFGSLNSTNGAVEIVAGKDVLLCADSKNGIFVKSNDHSGFVFQKGKITAQRIEIQIDGNPYELAFLHEGQLDALDIEENEGGIHLSVPSGDAMINGSLSARRIELLGQRIGLQNNAFIDVSGPNGGGTVLIGGDYQGKNSAIQNAEAIFMDTNAKILADATLKGDGGKVILWSDYSTEMRGQISARGGPDGGNGGFVEVSSKGNLQYHGTSDLRCESGTEGTLLLDPTQITITGATAGVALGNCAFPANTYASNIIAGTLLNTTLTTQLGLANTIITTFDGSCGPFLGTGDIIVSSPVLWTSNFSLTLNAARDIIVNNTGDIRNQGLGNGSVTLQAERNITVLADVRNANSLTGASVSGNVTLLAQTGNIQIGSPAQTRNVSVCARKGTTTVTANLGTISIFGGATYGGGNNDAFSAIGESSQAPIGGGGPSPIASGPIIVSCGGDLTMTGGTAIRAYALIGKGGSFQNAAGAGIFRSVNRTDITVNVGGNMTMLAGTVVNPTGGNPDAFIANAGYQSGSGGFNARNGNITLNVAGDLLIRGRGATAYIGLGSRASVGNGQCQIALRIGGDLTIDSIGPSSGPFGLVGIFSFGDPPLQHTMNVTGFIGGNLTLDGRIQPATFRCFNNNSNALIPAQTILHIGGEFNLVGGTQLAAIINPDPFFGSPPRYLWEIWAAGRIRAYSGTSDPNNIGATIYASSGPGGSNGQYGTIDVRSNQDIIQAGGYSSSRLFNSTSPGFQSPFSMIADAPFAAGQLWPAQSAIVGGNNIFSSTPLGSPSTALSSNGIGAVAFDANQYNISLVTFPPSPNGVSPPLFPTPASGPVFAISYNFASINISSADTFSNGAPADFLNIGTAAGSVTFQSNQTDISIAGHRDMQASNASLTSARDLLAIAQRNFRLQNGTIAAQRNIDLVVDNDFPVSPLIGPGFFSMNSSSIINSQTGYIRVYTAEQSLNQIDPAAQFISAANPNFFIPGTLFIDTDTEQWCTYYPNGSLGTPFRIFYKNCFQEVVEQAEIIITEQITEDFPPLNFPYYGMNDFYGWPSKFWIVYHLYNGESHRDLSYDAYLDKLPEKYFSRKKNDLLVQPYREFTFRENESR